MAFKNMSKESQILVNAVKHQEVIEVSNDIDYIQKIAL